MAGIHSLRNSQLEAAVATPGMARKAATLAAEFTAVEVRTEPGEVSGWHHHGEHTTFGYVLEGSLRFEFGPGGSESVELGRGDFFLVPPHVVHREGNPGAELQVLAGFRQGSGPAVVNVDGPAAH